MTHMKARFWATFLGLTAVVALTGCGAMTAAPQSNQGNGTSVAAPSDSTPNTSTDTATTRITENPAPARTTGTQPATTAPVTSAPVSSAPASAAPAASPPAAAPSTGNSGNPAPATPAVTGDPAPTAGTPSAPKPGTPATEAPAAPSTPAAEPPTQGPGGYPVVTPENSPRVGLDTNGKYAPGLKLAAMDQGRLFFAYPEHWTVIATSDSSMSISSPDGSVEGGIDIRQAGATKPEMPQMSHTRTVYGQAQGSDHAANVVVGRTDGPFNTDRLSWRLQDPTTGGSGLALSDGRAVDAQLYAIIGEGEPQLTGAEIEQVIDGIPQHPDHLAAQNILGTVHHLG